MRIAEALEILRISELEATDARTLKARYRAALLRSHPDKQRTTDHGRTLKEETPRSQDVQKVAAETETTELKTSMETIDEVRTAYLVLLERLGVDETTSHGIHTTGEDRQTSYATLDLDDFEYDAASASWLHPCRCGHGYRISEEHLENGMDVVGCDGCSLYVKVTYQVASDDEDPLD